jgi:PAS domain S-box-containing protein
VASLHEGVILQEASGRVALFNPAAEKAFGIRAEEVVGETSTSYDWNLVTADGTPLPGEEHPSMHTLRTGEPCSDVVLGITRPDSERRWVSVSTEPVWDDGGERRPSAVAISFVDITERLRADEERRADAALLRGVLDAMPSGCAIYEVRGDGRRGDDYVIRYFNSASLAMEGLGLQDVLGKTLAFLRPAIDDYGLIPVFRRVWKTGEPALYPAKRYADERYERYYENHVFRLPGAEIVAIYEDVTERETMLESLRRGEETWRSYVENAPYGVFITDAQGRYLQVNPEACRTTGYSERELLTRSIVDLLPPETQELGLEHFSQLLATGKSVGETLYLTKSGERRWWSVSAVRLSDDRFLGFTADVTDRVRAREQLADVNALLEERVHERTAELEAANGELEAFNYSVSHDLRAPLRHISGFANLLREEAGDDLNEEQRHCFERIDSAVGKMGQLIDDLIEFSRVGRSDLVLGEVDTRSLVAEAVEAVRPDAGHREIEWVFGALPPAFADAPALRLVWMNLLDNAVKYTAPHDRARIEIGGRHEDGATIFWVRDDGVGFDPAYADKLFGVFQRLHNDGRFSGTGIGLATVRRVVSRHGGRVWAEGAVESGATVWFSLPWPRD